MGNDVVGLDVDAAKIALLENGAIPIHEPGLKGLVQRNALVGRLRPTTDVASAVAHGTLQFMAAARHPTKTALPTCGKCSRRRTPTVAT